MSENTNPRRHVDREYNHEAQKAWAKAYGLRKSGRKFPFPVWTRTKHGVPGLPGYADFLDMPCRDHEEIYINKNGRKTALVSHPYDIDEDALKAFALAQNMRLEIHPKERSWYYAGHTWLVVLWYPT